MSFVFFDTETTGLKHGFDQIVHFAAIRTDANLNEIGRFEVRSRLLPHVLPHPAALRTNGLPIGRLTDPSLPVPLRHGQSDPAEVALVVAFDLCRLQLDPFRRGDVAARVVSNASSRLSHEQPQQLPRRRLGLVMAAAAVSPACLNVPTGPEGRPIFRLEQLALANGVAHEQAHNAMSDVIATLELCRLVHQRSPELWQRFVRFSKKATVADFVEAEDGFMLTEFFANQAYHAPVVCIGRDPDQANGRFCLRLNGDVDRFAAMTDDELRS